MAFIVYVLLVCYDKQALSNAEPRGGRIEFIQNFIGSALFSNSMLKWEGGGGTT